MEALTHGNEYYEKIKKVVDTYHGAKDMYNMYIEH